MSWVQLLTLIAMVLVSAAVMSYVFQWLKERLKVPENWRAVILYALCRMCHTGLTLRLRDIQGPAGHLVTAPGIGIVRPLIDEFLRPPGLRRRSASHRQTTCSSLRLATSTVAGSSCGGSGSPYSVCLLTSVSMISMRSGRRSSPFFRILGRGLSAPVPSQAASQDPPILLAASLAGCLWTPPTPASIV